MGPGPPGWGLDVGFTTLPLIKLSIGKPERGSQKGSMKEVHYGGEGPHWAVVSMNKKKMISDVYRLYNIGDTIGHCYYTELNT